MRSRRRCIVQSGTPRGRRHCSRRLRAQRSVRGVAECEVVAPSRRALEVDKVPLTTVKATWVVAVGTDAKMSMTNCRTRLSSLMMLVCVARARTNTNPMMGRMAHFATASAQMLDTGSREIGLGIRMRPRVEPRTRRPSGTEALPRKVAVSRSIDRGGSPSGAVGRQS